jgi:hypothetical protein
MSSKPWKIMVRIVILPEDKYWLSKTVFFLVHIDVTRVFNSVLLQQTQSVDSNGEKTIAALYVTWSVCC